MKRTTAAGKEKRRFTPKAQAKTEPPPPDTDTAKNDLPKVEPKSTTSHSGGGKGRGRGRERGGKGGRGRGRFVVPTGQAFFTGGGASHPSASSQSRPPIQSHIQEGGREGNSKKAVSNIKQEKVKEEENDSAELFAPSRTTSSPEFLQQDSAATCSAWPPEEFDELAPVELPFGPRSVQKHMELAEQSIFAPADDSAAIEKEENESMFLLQLPSSIAKMHAQNQVSDDEEKDHPIQSSPLKPGKLGKLQITKSGKVFLIVDNNNHNNHNNNNSNNSSDSGGGIGVSTAEEDVTARGSRRRRSDSGNMSVEGMESAPSSLPLRFEVNRGITPSFMQLVVSTTLSGDEKKKETDADGSLHLLGTVTDKIIATPDFEIGQRQSHLASASEHQGDEGKSSSALKALQSEVMKDTATANEVNYKPVRVKKEPL